MNRYIIVGGLPYLYAGGKAYKVRWDDRGFTVGEEVELASPPDVTYSELSIKAKCANRLDSISASCVIEDKEPQKEAEVIPEQEEEAEEAINFSSMSVSELKDYANDKGIKLGSARTRSAIIEVINASMKK